MNHHPPLTHPIDGASITASTDQPNLILLSFIQQWEQDYAAQVRGYPLFQPAITATWATSTQKQFARYFYHIRGHFFKFLWELGNEASTAAVKQKVLDNIGEEFGREGRSHEQLYYVFAKAVGVPDLKQTEWLNETHHCAAIKAYNQQHLTWLNDHDGPSKWAAFAAYEKLDNIDYVNLSALAESFGLERRALAFFKVHQQADHFDRLVEDLQPIWQKQPDVVREAFRFIGQHQANLWRWLSGVLCAA